MSALQQQFGINQINGMTDANLVNQIPQGGGGVANPLIAAIVNGTAQGAGAQPWQLGAGNQLINAIAGGTAPAGGSGNGPPPGTTPLNFPAQGPPGSPAGMSTLNVPQMPPPAGMSAAPLTPSPLPADSGPPAVAAASASGPQAQAIHQQFLRNAAADEALSDLRMQSQTPSKSYDPTTPAGGYGFDADSIAGNIPTGNVDVPGLVQKAVAADSNRLNPDMASRFAPGGRMYVDDRNQLLKSMTDNTSIALPAHRIKAAGTMTDEEIATLPPAMRRAVEQRDAKAAEDVALRDRAEAKGQRWHGDYVSGFSTDDEAYGEQRELGRASEARMSEKRHTAAVHRNERESQLLRAFAGGVGNSPIDPEFAKWNPEAAARMEGNRMLMADKEKDRGLQREIEAGRTAREASKEGVEERRYQAQQKTALEKEQYERATGLLGEAGKLGDNPMSRQLTGMGYQLLSPLMDRGPTAGSQAPVTGAPLPGMASLPAPHQAAANSIRPRLQLPLGVQAGTPDATRELLSQAARYKSELGTPEGRATMLMELRDNGVSPQAAIEFAAAHSTNPTLWESVTGDDRAGQSRAPLANLIRGLVHGTPDEARLNEALAGVPDWPGLPRRAQKVLQYLIP